jgi:hypothetical protein
MPISEAYDFIEAGHRIFGLHGGNDDGSCACGYPECKAAYKHPIASNWQVTPDWSDEQLEGMEEMGQLDTGYGVLVKGLLVVDVDARNGGVDAYHNLVNRLGVDLAATSGLTVQTGSGQGSMHVYYKAPEGVSLVQNHKDFVGIDFKSSGFCVGAGSMHASGNRYQILFGSPSEIGDAPPELIELLRRPDAFRADCNGAVMDVTGDDLAGMLKHVDYDCDRPTWINIGMALHHATGGSGFDLWNDWSSKGEKYPGMANLRNQWDRFGKSANPVTLGTLIYHAEAGGWEESVEFIPTTWFEEPAEVQAVKSVDKKKEEAPEALDGNEAPKTKKGLTPHPFHINGVDLLRPPGFVGEVCKWINDQSRFPRENLAVAAALISMSNVVGLGWTDDIDGVTANLFAMCVAGSATGKEAIMQSINAVHQAAGIQRATVGSIKSEQEIIRNLIDNQAAFYVIDEFGILLKTITTSKEAYHSGVIGALMSAYSKANSFMPMNGDTKREVRKTLVGELKSCRKAVMENEDPTKGIERRIPHLERALESIDNGLEKPYLSLIGFTTPVTFDSLVTPEQATNGFIGRSIIISEKETNPRAKKGFKSSRMGDRLALSIRALYDRGTYDSEAHRVEWYGERSQIRTEHEARDMLDMVADWAYTEAERHKEFSGLEAIPRRAREMVSKISLILAVPSGLRTAEHVRWAYAFVERDIREKTMLAYANENEETSPAAAVKARVINMLGDGHSETLGVVINRCKKWPRLDVEKVLKVLVENGTLGQTVTRNPTNGKETIRLSIKD